MFKHSTKNTFLSFNYFGCLGFQILLLIMISTLFLANLIWADNWTPLITTLILLSLGLFLLISWPRRP
ncbi:MAG TPA: hypothetical protein VLL52_12300 [Anaerolineae bacterium]|nr:hypothetical protein [Anaerolineae bacterium]